MKAVGDGAAIIVGCGVLKYEREVAGLCCGRMG
jgi:hypothetical protein